MVAPAHVPATAEPLVPLLPFQLADLQSNARFQWSCWSRQTGKSFTKSLRRILRGLQRRRNQIFLSAGERQSRELMQKAQVHCQALKIAMDFHDERYFQGMSIKQLEINLPNKVRIIALPANPATARGYTGDVLLDEFAMHEDDREIWSAIFPSLLRGDGELDIASTPRGRHNMFFRLRDNELFHRNTITLHDAIAQGLHADAEQLRLAMADDLLFRQEFLCEFLDENSALLPHAQISACIDAKLRLCTHPEQLASETRDMYVGVDVGRRHDLTVIWVLAREEDHLITRALFELSAAPFHTQRRLLFDILAARHVRRCCIDAGGLGMQLAEETVDRFGKHRVHAVTLTAHTRTVIAGQLRVAVESARIRIPNDHRVVRDWQSIERSVSQTGRLLLTAKRQDGSHADRFWAAALAMHAAAENEGLCESMSDRPLCFARPGAW